MGRACCRNQRSSCNRGRPSRSARSHRPSPRPAGWFWIYLQSTAAPDSAMTKAYTVPSIEEYLRERLMPVEGAIPHIPGIEMFGNSIPVGTVGGDLFEYINFQQRYDTTARVQPAQRTSQDFLEPIPPGLTRRN